MANFINLQNYLKKVQSLDDKKAIRRTKETAVKKLAQIYLEVAKKNTNVVGVQKRRVKIKGRWRTIRSSSEKMKQKWIAKKPIHTISESKVTVMNTASYASYVNDGHRQEVGRYVPILGKTLKKPFVMGRHMREKAINAVNKNKQKILEKEIEKLFEKKGF